MILLRRILSALVLSSTLLIPQAEKAPEPLPCLPEVTLSAVVNPFPACAQGGER